MITICLDNVVKNMISISLDNVIIEFITKGNLSRWKKKAVDFIWFPLIFKINPIFFIFTFDDVGGGDLLHLI